MNERIKTPSTRASSPNEEESNEGREFLPLMRKKVMREGVTALDEEESNEGRIFCPKRGRK